MNWYQVKVRLEREQKDGKNKKVSEEYLTIALTFGEAERTILNEAGRSSSSPIEVVTITRKPYTEIITSKLCSEVADKWYKCKINFITIDEVNGKEKKTSSYFLVQSSSTLTAQKSVDEFMAGTMCDYEVKQVDETKIIDVFNFTSKYK